MLSQASYISNYLFSENMDNRITYLLQQYGKALITEAEKAELILLFETDQQGALIKEALAAAMEKAEPAEGIEEAYWKNMAQQILQANKASNSEIGTGAKVKRLQPRRKWIRAAASVLVLMAAGYLLTNQPARKTTQQIASVHKAVVNDVAPGKQGAILKLADGSQVVLDSLGNGVVAVQNGTQLILKNGQLAYDTKAKATGPVLYNTVSTPRGRQFKLILPDGSQAWMNAASSITYPIAFTGALREVSVTGEVYFEVAKNAAMPFRVRLNEHATVEVLGTHFNINAYNDEASIQTTLLEGKIKMVSDKNTAILFPNQQARINNEGKNKAQIEILKDVDTEKIMAWKDGLFNFEGLKLKEVMRQLSRWYDIDILYENKVPDIEFVGEMSKNISLSGVLKGLQGAGVHFKIEDGHRLVVLP